jgi:UDP-2-acetamido-2-deoxy-ribo-hexuluronate aminotransferase
MALGIGPGDEVIVPAFTFAASAEVVLLVGATPVLVDVEADSCNMNVRALEDAVSDKTRAIMPVSLYGQPSDMAEINELAEPRGLHVIEDGAQSFGADYGNRKSCGLSHFGCTSFFPSKLLDVTVMAEPSLRMTRRLRRRAVKSGSTANRRYRHTRLAWLTNGYAAMAVLAKLTRLNGKSNVAWRRLPLQ